MQPCRVHASLLTGKVATSDLFLPLDSLLATAVLRSDEKLTTGLTPETFRDVPLPLERRGAGDAWYWAASFALGTPCHEEMVHWHKRADEDIAESAIDFGGRRGVINTKAGLYKGYRMPLVTYLFPGGLTWYAVGDMDVIRELLVSQITHVGKKPSQGFGRVLEWTVEPCDEDLSGLRCIPDPDGDLMMGVRPPYFLAWAWQRAGIPDDGRLACNYARKGGAQ